MSSGAAPLISRLKETIPAVAAGVAQDQTVGEAPFAGSVNAVTFTPEAAITGQATNFRTFRLVNKGAAGAGTTEVASLAFSAGGVTAAAFDEKAITLGVAANLLVAEGDILAWDEVVTGTGLASPGGLVQVEISRT